MQLEREHTSILPRPRRRGKRIRRNFAAALAALPGLALAPAPAGPPPDLTLVHGVTISCQTWGWEWGQRAFGDELDRLAALGVNWVAIHPYASVGGDGSVRWRREHLDPGRPAEHLRYPIEAAHARGMGILMKPHLAYWGSPFRWRGEIGFSDPERRARFWQAYSAWILQLARATSAADAFCVGTELDNLGVEPARWRELIAAVREVTDARLVYAANWDRFEEVTFWDALDAIGVQAYFPLSDREDPDAEVLLAGWRDWISRLRALHERTGKPVVFTELGYDDSRHAAARPWEDDPRGRGAPPDGGASELQARCLEVALRVLGQEERWLRGAFLWKWFVGDPGRDGGSFLVDQPRLHAVLRAVWERP